MIRLRMKDYSIILIDNLKKYEPDHQTNFINMNSFLVEKYYNLIKNK